MVGMGRGEIGFGLASRETRWERRLRTETQGLPPLGDIQVPAPEAPKRNESRCQAVVPGGPPVS